MNEENSASDSSSDLSKNESSPGKKRSTNQAHNDRNGSMKRQSNKSDGDLSGEHDQRKHKDSSRRSHHHRRHHSSKESGRQRHRSRSRSPSRKHNHHRSRKRSSRSPRKDSSSRSSKSSRDATSKHHGSRTRSRSPPCRSRSPPTGYDKAMDAQERLARRLERARDLMRHKHQQSKIEKEEELKKISGLSVYDRAQEAAKRASQIVGSGSGSVTTSKDGISALASAQIEALKAKALAETGIVVPSYYNPLAVNPMSYAHQAAKRKKLWAKKEDTGNDAEKKNTVLSGKTAIWSGVKFGDDKSNEKFAKLMGIKGDQGHTGAETSEIIKKQAEVFQKLDMQYQQARITTHTQRGLGLGFSSSMIDPNNGSYTQPGPST